MAKRQPRLSQNVHLLLSDQEDQAVTPSDGIPLSKHLWDQTSDLRQKVLQTYFVQGLGNGTLNPTAFGGFMVQDSLYCYLAKGAIDITARKTPQGSLKSYLLHESHSYEGYYMDLYKKWHIADANGIQLGDGCKDYTDYVESVASTMDSIYFIVSMIPCMKLWPWLGGQLQGGSFGVYKGWCNENFDPTYVGYKKLDAFVDAAARNGTIDKDRANKVFTRCMAGELAFFDSPKSMK